MNKYKKSFINNQISVLWNTMIDLFCHPIIIEACIHFDKGKVLHRNWGDDINIFFLKVLFKRNIAVFHYSIYSRFLRKIGRGNNYLIIGSTITMLTNEKSIIWGAGVIDPTKPLIHKPQKVLAVRGPLTREYLLDNEVNCPCIYGDPALLLPKVYSPRVEKKYKLGIIPHYDDFNSPLLDTFHQNSSVLLIRMEGYQDWHDVIDQVLSCERIASSSLHGLIIAETYHIPNLWIKISGNLSGGNFKFHDFFESIEKYNQVAYPITKSSSLQDILKQLDDYQPGHIDLRPLISCCPFKIKDNILMA